MAPTINLHCFNPHFDVPFIDAGTNQHGIGEAATGLVQFNINCPSTGPEVVLVDGFNNGICTAKISAGFRFLEHDGGIFDIDGVDIFSAWLNPPKPPPPPPPVTALKEHVSIVWTRPAPDTGVFTVLPKDNLLQGTINVRFTVRYEAAT